MLDVHDNDRPKNKMNKKRAAQRNNAHRDQHALGADFLSRVVHGFNRLQPTQGAR